MVQVEVMRLMVLMMMQTGIVDGAGAGGEWTQPVLFVRNSHPIL